MNLGTFADLDGTTTAEPLIYGSKIHMLSRLLRASVPVPKGFYFTLTASGGFDGENLDQNEREFLKNRFDRLVSDSSAQKYIVRSSSSVEDKPEHHFSGLFESRKDVTTFDDLLSAIVSCFASRNTDVIRDYALSFGIGIDDIRFAILVQQQIEPAISGLAHLEYQPHKTPFPTHDYIELTDGNMEALIAGATNPIVFELIQEPGRPPNLASRSHGDGLHADKLKPHLTELVRCFENIKKTLRESVLVEFCIEQGNGPSIFQAQPYRLYGVAPIRAHKTIHGPVRLQSDRRTKVLEDEDKFGLKGAAMIAFQKMGLFHPPVVYFEAGTPLFKIKEKLEGLKEWKDGLTIRYSKGDEIGLPRIFVKDYRQTYVRIADEYDKSKDYFTIVHGYLNVERSYELILDNEYIVLEHIPGLWESDNMLEPDVMIFDRERSSLLKVLKVTEERKMTLVRPGSTEQVLESPRDDEFFKSRFLKVVDIANSTLKPRFSKNLPLNFHFVEDNKKEFSFLNIRRINRLTKKYIIRGGSYFHVRKLQDLAGWDGRKDILLTITTERGKERELIALARALPKGNVAVHITFGYLSHPAILLREFGINVVPVYLNREIKEFQI